MSCGRWSRASRFFPEPSRTPCSFTLAPLVLSLSLSCGGGVRLAGDEEAADRARPDAESPDVGPEAVDPGVEDGASREGVDEAGGPDVTDAGPIGCERQDVDLHAPCGPTLAGAIWNGAHCTAARTCECTGADCDEIYPSVEECVAARIACYDFDCEPQAVADDVCRDLDCDAALEYFWDGRDCFDMVRCDCAGEDCDTPASSSLEECRAVHAGCDAAVCQATGGQWFSEAAGFCVYHCGLAAPGPCESPTAGCQCPPGRTFASGTGCAPDPACTRGQICVATMGTWHPIEECSCTFFCGQASDCDDCMEACDCGPHRNFVEGEGCVPDAECPEADRADICRSTGGVWHDCSAGDTGCSCGDYACGIHSWVLPCLAPGCDCGRFETFDDVRGCVLDASCATRLEGETCTGAGPYGTCRDGLVCCNTCSAPVGCPVCRPPCCPEAEACLDHGCLNLTEGWRADDTARRRRGAERPRVVRQPRLPERDRA